MDRPARDPPALPADGLPARLTAVLFALLASGGFTPAILAPTPEGMLKAG